MTDEQIRILNEICWDSSATVPNGPVKDAIRAALGIVNAFRQAMDNEQLVDIGVALVRPSTITKIDLQAGLAHEKTRGRFWNRETYTVRDNSVCVYFNDGSSIEWFDEQANFARVAIKVALPQFVSMTPKPVEVTE